MNFLLLLIILSVSLSEDLPLKLLPNGGLISSIPTQQTLLLLKLKLFRYSSIGLLLIWRFLPSFFIPPFTCIHKSYFLFTVLFVYEFLKPSSIHGCQ